MKPVTINLGAGVQSTTLLLMAAHGEIKPLPEIAVFADTGDEPDEVYRHLEWLESQTSALTLGRLEVIRVSAGHLGNDLLEAAAGTRRRVSNPPLFIITKHGPAQRVDHGILPRGCTRDYKIRPIRKALRELGYGPQKPIESWLGLSWDELVRVKPSDVKWQQLTYPLIERRMTRADCLRWMEEKGYPRPPRSACVYCPYHSNAEWRRIRDTDPAGWARAIEVDEGIRTGLPGLQGEAFLHADRVPLADVDLSESAQETLFEMDECEGGCFL